MSDHIHAMTSRFPRHADNQTIHAMKYTLKPCIITKTTDLKEVHGQNGLRRDRGQNIPL